MAYKLYIEDLNFTMISHDVIKAFPPYSGTSSLNFYKSSVDNGNSFNLYDYVKNNIYLPNYNNNTSQTVDINIYTFKSGNPFVYNRQFIRCTYVSGNRYVQLQFRTNSGIAGQLFTYDFSRPQPEYIKYLTFLTFEPWKYNGNQYYGISFVVGGYSIYYTDDASHTELIDKTNLIFSELVYENEIYYNYMYSDFTYTTSQSAYTDNLLEWIDNIEEESNNPDEQYSGEGGGQGTVDTTSDYIPSDGTPLVSAISSGFTNLYNPTLAQIQALHSFMMGDDFLNNVKKLIANPIDYIITLHLVPVTPTTGASETIKVGGIDTLVSMPIITSQYLTFDCGTINLEEYWGSFIDYSPFTKVSIYLPFIGVRELNLDDVMSSSLHLTYRIDILSGECVASIQVMSSRKVNAVLYNYNGNMAMDVPITSTDYRDKVRALTGAVTSGAMVAVTGGASPSADVNFASSLANVALSKENFTRSGSISGNVGMMSNFTPFIIISRPNQSLPSTYKTLNGYTSNIGGVVNDFTGFTSFSEVKTDGLTCTDTEKDMIVNLLKEGVFI